MNQELEKVTLWLAANKLSLHVGKTNFMIFKSKNKKVQHKVTVNIADQNIKQVDHISISFPAPQSFSRTFHSRVFPTILTYLTAWNRLHFLSLVCVQSVAC